MSLTEEDVRQALIEKAKKFWSKKAIETLAIEKVEHDVCYHYVLESFIESREAKEGSEPLSTDAQSRHEQNIKKYVNFPDRAKWSNAVIARVMEWYAVLDVLAAAGINVRFAAAKAQESSTTGTVQRSDYHTECEILGNKITKVTGTVKFSDCQLKLESLQECPSEELKQTSVELLKQHSDQLSVETQTSRHVKQRHTIELIPIAKGTFRIGQKSKEFVVYGNECNCHVPKKPSRCSIL
ncbi:protein SSUH2 like protein [Ditylenchus destructor]|uniref:Protein SSUH2 like protein n=1 Tax=Ditylenchus destructor TaxID=166010 RepID=A0AAD4NF69_9BILA|nr:protein SSUH2 like protein [Ditylenchus destructor]